jgi:hypothetical protein
MVKHSSGVCCRGFLNANKDRLGPAKKTPGFLSGKDSAASVGATWNGEASISHLQDKWKRVLLDGTPSGNQPTLLISEEAFSFSLAQSNKLNSRFHTKTLFPSTKPRKTRPSSINLYAQYNLLALFPHTRHPPVKNRSVNARQIAPS